MSEENRFEVGRSECYRCKQCNKLIAYDGTGMDLLAQLEKSEQARDWWKTNAMTKQTEINCLQARLENEMDLKEQFKKQAENFSSLLKELTQ